MDDIEADMKVTRDNMRNTLRLWASGVAVVTTAHEGAQAGMTVSAFNSLCLEPPLVLVCLHKESRVASMARESGVFAVSVLDAEQAAVSDRFAGRGLAEGEDKFDGVATFTAVTGSPLIEDAIAWLDCKIDTVHDGVTHWIVVGEVLAVDFREEDMSPLIYFDRGYREVAREEEPT